MSDVEIINDEQNFENEIDFEDEEIEVVEEEEEDTRAFDEVEIIEEKDSQESLDDEEFETIAVSDWKSPQAFEEYVVANSRQRPKIFGDSKNSLRRAWHYFANLQKELLSGVSSDASYGELSEESLRMIDGIEEGLEASMTQLAEKIEKGLTKTATKSSRFTYVVSPFIFGLARILVNGKVSQGKNIEDLFEELNKKYKLNDREMLELRFILNDMGHPMVNSFVDGHDMMEQYFN